MPSISTPEEYTHCLVEILEAAGGRASRGHIYREFEKRYTSSIPRDEARSSGRIGGPPRWRRALDEAAARMVEKKRLFRPSAERLELT